MQKRALFVLRGNFQLAFLCGVAMIVAAGILFAAVAHYAALARILEGVAFSAHLSLRSSGTLIWQAIVEVTAVAVGASLLTGCLAMAWGFWFQELLLRALANGLRHLAQGELTFRLAPRRVWGRSLLRAFNDSAQAMEARARRARELLSAAAAAPSQADVRQRLQRLIALQAQLRALFASGDQPRK